MFIAHRQRAINAVNQGSGIIVPNRGLGVEQIGVESNGLIAPATDYSAGTISDETSDVRQPSPAQFVTFADGATNMNLLNIDSVPIVDKILHISVKAASSYLGGAFNLWLSNVPTTLGSPRIQWRLGDATTGDFKPGKWADYTLIQDDLSNDDVLFDWDAVQSNRIQESVTGAEGALIIGGVRTGGLPRPKIIYSLDDGSQAQYDNRSEWISRNIPVTWYPSRDNIDTGAVTTANIQAAVAEGFGEVGLHGSTNLTTLTGSPLTTEIAAMQDWAGARGFKTNLLAYPNGAYNDEVLTACANAGIAFGRALSPWGRFWESHRLGFSTPLEMSAMTLTSVTAGTLAANVISEIDDAIARGYSLNIVTHSIVASGATGNEVTLTDLRTVLDYIETKVDAGECDAVTTSDYLAHANKFNKFVI